MSESTKETKETTELEKIVRQNGNQAASAMADFVHEQGGGSSIEGLAGDVVVCDGNGGAVGDNSLHISDETVRSQKDVTVEGIIEATDYIQSTGGDIIARTGNLVAGSGRQAGEVRLFDDGGSEWSVKVVNGQLTCTQVQ